MATLLQNQYGKHRVRVLKVHREESRHEVMELECDVLLSGDLDDSYLSDDNQSIVPTDTVKNTVHVLAHDHLEKCRTSFAKVLGDHFLTRYPHLSGVSVELRERRWGRLSVHGSPHPHAFAAEQNGTWFARSEFARDSAPIQRAGIKDHLIMKTTESAFVDYNVCEFTTLPPAEDRILATRLTAEWTLSEGAGSPGSIDASFLESAHEVLATKFSPSVQRTLFELGELFLERAPDVSQVELRMPNV
ncbi:MAG: factor-independent urate hydroxylase, partial [Verrucomicrobiota bacterium]